MSRLPTTGTQPELALRRALHHRGMRYRVDVRALPGRPDVVLTRARMAIFVDGCFWHGCPRHAVAPKANTEWWATKIAANRARDERNSKVLREGGWTVVRVWEHEDLRQVAAHLEDEWRSRTGRAPR